MQPNMQPNMHYCRMHQALLLLCTLAQTLIVGGCASHSHAVRDARMAYYLGHLDRADDGRIVYPDPVETSSSPVPLWQPLWLCRCKFHGTEGFGDLPGSQGRATADH